MLSAQRSKLCAPQLAGGQGVTTVSSAKQGGRGGRRLSRSKNSRLKAEQTAALKTPAFRSSAFRVNSPSHPNYRPDAGVRRLLKCAETDRSGIAVPRQSETLNAGLQRCRCLKMAHMFISMPRFNRSPRHVKVSDWQLTLSGDRLRVNHS